MWRDIGGMEGEGEMRKGWREERETRKYGEIAEDMELRQEV